jgi:UDP-glucose 4-epimerase
MVKKLNNMRYLITGASGFIGRNLVKQLLSTNDDFELLLVQRDLPVFKDKRVTVKLLDLNEDIISNFKDENFDYIIHLAQSPHFRDFPDYAIDIFNVNTRSVVELANLGISKGVKGFLYASTGSVYDMNGGILNESSPTNASSFYAATKIASETLLVPYSNYFSVDILRIFNPYGPNQKGMLLPGLIERIRNEEAINLNSGKGMVFKPIFISDLVELIIRFLGIEKKKEYNIYNLGGSEITDIGEISEEIATLLGKELRKNVVVDAPVVKLVADSQKLYSKVNYFPVVNWRDGIKNCCYEE